MTTNEKVLGVVALVATLLLGLVIGHYTAQAPVAKAVFGSVQTAATFATAPSVSNQGGLYLYDTDNNSGLEVQGYAHFDSSSQAYFMGTTTFSGPIVGGTLTSTLSTLTVTGASSLNTLSVSGTSTLTGTSTISLPILASPFWVKTNSSYCTKVTASTTAAALTITTSTVCQ